MTDVKIVAARGICSLPELFAKKDSFDGNTLSMVRAWSTRGAPNKLPTALDSVAPHMPSRIANPQKAIFCIIILSVTNVIASALNAKKKGTTI